MPGINRRSSSLLSLAVACFCAGFALPASSIAQRTTTPPAIAASGSGPDTYVLLSGMVGGVTGLAQLAQLLAADGNRVLTIDPYQLSIDSSVVSFDALARRVDAILGQRGIVGAHLVGHAHGGGVALRLAANYPARVSEIILLDVGAQASNKGPVFSSSMRLVPIIARLPFGRGFIRGRFIKGLRENSGSTQWLDDSTSIAYTQPVVDNIGRVVSLAIRLSKAEEPEPLSEMLARVCIPVTLVRGGVHRPAGPGTEELSALDQLGSLLSVEVIEGAGHFPHEEAPAVVLRMLRHRRMLVTAKIR